jgi:pimeloyl-ACP methyl ester carboxylesterase
MSQVSKQEIRYHTSDGLELVADAWGEDDAPPVILLHGGGQTRHAWGGTARRLAEAGFHALSIDLRGHGDSAWHEEGDYQIDSYVNDLHEIMATLDKPPALVGASLGGMVSMVSQGEVHPGTASALVLVDITPRIERKGVQRIVDFMTANPHGYESLEDVADAIAEYLPQRRRPKDLSGLEKNLRVGDDGRYRWHWDPAFLTAVSRRTKVANPDRLFAAAAKLVLPTLLVRGRMSDIVSEETAREFLAIVPHAKYVDVADAAHMVAGDQNDVFADAVIEFLGSTHRLPSSSTSQQSP